jgi:hypothetical protein
MRENLRLLNLRYSRILSGILLGNNANPNINYNHLKQLTNHPFGSIKIRENLRL